MEDKGTVLVSYIVIGHNVSKFLERSLTSLIDITDPQRDEIIYVDDNSDDGSPDLARSLLNVRQNTKIVHSGTHTGPAGARNVGVSVASGEYVFLHDADDYMPLCAPQKIEACIEGSNHPDVIVIPFSKLTESKRQEFTTDSVKCLRDVINWVPAPWARVIKRSKYVNGPEGIIGEDVVWHFIQCDNFETAAVIDGSPCYVYDRTHNSISDTSDYFKTNSATLEQILLADDFENAGYSYKYVTDNLRCVAELMDMKGKFKHIDVENAWKVRTVRSIRNLMSGHFAH